MYTVEIARLKHQDAVLGIAFSPDGSYLATASMDKTARVWEIDTGREVARMEHKGIVSAVAFSPGGHYLASGSYDRTARVWLWQSEHLITEACNQLTRNLTFDEWQMYLLDESYQPTCTSIYFDPLEVIKQAEAYLDIQDIDRASRTFQQAIEDFTAFLQWSKENNVYESLRPKRESWIAVLEAGQSPFNTETLRALRSE